MPKSNLYILRLLDTIYTFIANELHVQFEQRAIRNLIILFPTGFHCAHFSQYLFVIRLYNFSTIKSISNYDKYTIFYIYR